MCAEVKMGRIRSRATRRHAILLGTAWVLLILLLGTSVADGDDVATGSGHGDEIQRMHEMAVVERKPQSPQLPGATSRRDAEKSPNPEDHYFCGRGFADAASSCEHPCPSGSLDECPAGMLCYYDTPCDRRDLPGVPTESPVRANVWQPPTKAPWSEDDPKLSYYCGEGWQHASDTCGTWCPDADDTQCPWGQFCFRDTTCKKDVSSPSLGLWYPPTQAPYADDDPRLRNFCGTSWLAAGESCQKWCPDGDDEKCPYGQSCFSDTTCKKTPSPTGSPTFPPPTRRPTPRPTGPSQSPTLAPQPRLPESPANNMFCGVDWQQATNLCSLENHCGETGDAGCKSHEYCWHKVDCDIREFVPFEDGGWLGKPTHQEIAESMGLTWPSDDPTDHYFCGATFDKASKRCRRPCPNGSPLSCDNGEYCFEDTPCDFRVTPGYGITEPPTQRPTMPPIPYDNRENYSFCGSNWLHANSCKMQWCGDNSACPAGQSCFADTECNIQDRKPMPPTMSPTHPPVPYEHKSNSFFCGATYSDAVEKCSAQSYCRSGLHSECDAGLFCWAGVACNIQDMIAPTPKRTASPTIDSPRPTYERDDPRNSRFCGASWGEASGSCKDGNRARWCPNGTDDECPKGQTCWADTMCNMNDFSLAPSPPPSGAPTVPPPTEAPIDFNDPSRTSFCGSSYLDAEANCSVETNCPSGLQTDCPSGGYCWTVTAPNCNVLLLVGPTPPPTLRPTQSPSRRFMPSEAPSFPPTADPTEKPTASPLAESDERSYFFCGKSWADASEKCSIRCPEMTGCPEGQYCFGHTACKMPSASEPTQSTESNTVPPTPNPTRQFTQQTESPTTQPSPANSLPLVIPPNPPTISPSLSTKTGPQSYLPYSIVSLPKPPMMNAQRILHIVESVQSSLENEIFVVEARSGTQFPSTLYTYDGFLEALNFWINDGVKSKYLFIGAEQSAVGVETESVEIEYGLANLALFIAKMMDTIAFERCDPNLVSCGMPALDKTFQDNNLRLQCSPLSFDVGMECPNQSGCVCILGVLNHYIGVQTGLSNGKYSSTDFCQTNLLESICSRRLDQGEELRWIAALSYWVLFIQQYDDGDWRYIDGLRDFVRGGMIDVSFVNTVASLSVLGTNEHHADELDIASSAFVQNFFKAIIKLSEGASHPMPDTQPEMATSPPTSSPSELAHPVQTPGPMTTSKPTSSTNIDGPPTLDPTGMPADSPATRSDKPTSSASDDRGDLNFVAGERSLSPTPIGANAAGIDQLPANSGSPIPVFSNQDEVWSADNSFPPSGTAWDGLPLPYGSSAPSGTANDSTQHPVVSPSAGPSSASSQSPTGRRHWDYDEEPWYKSFFTHSRGYRRCASLCITCFMIATFLLF